MLPPTPSPAPSTDLEQRLGAVGRDLERSLSNLLAHLPSAQAGPQRLAAELGLDKVLASRLLKALRSGDPYLVLHQLPGPAPLQRLVRAAAHRGAPEPQVLAAGAAVEAFAELIRSQLGDRGYLDAILAAYVPEARREAELRSKQTAWRALSQIKGVTAELNLSAVLLHPSSDGQHVDIVWVFGLLGLRRLRPGAPVQFATRRFSKEPNARRPSTLDGTPVFDLESLRLNHFCSARPAQLDVHQSGDVVHYRLGGDDFGPGSEVDFLLAEANFREIQRYVPKELGRRGYVFSEVSTPARHLIFDVLVHLDVYPGSEPELAIYDTALNGAADVNDRTRDVDRLDLLETVVPLGTGPARLRAAGAPRYADLLRHVFERTRWDSSRFRGYRVEIDYPLYGSQVALSFDPPSPPAVSNATPSQATGS